MTKFMKGKKYVPLSASTITRLIRLGYKEVVWKNGDFFLL